MNKSNEQIFNLLLLLDKNEKIDIDTVNSLGYLILRSNNYIYIENYLFNISWNSVDENILIELIKKVASKQDKKINSLIIKKLFQLKKFDIIEKIYYSIGYNNEDMKKLIINNTRKFIVNNFNNEDVYDEFLDAKNFLGILCDNNINQDNIDRSLELVKHIKPKKYIKTTKNV